MSPVVTASSETGNDTFSVFDWPAASWTLAQPTSRCGGATSTLTGWWTYTGTTAVPALDPVFVTVKIAVALP